MHIRLPSGPTAISTLALFVALGGTSYAALNLPKNSVGNKQLKNNAVTTKKIANDAVTTAKIAPGSVTASKIDPAGLSVTAASYANAAGNATNADNATNATNATNASEASGLGGIPSKYFAPVLYTHVFADGGQAGPGESNGFQDATISKGAGSAFCIANLPFTPSGGSVSIDYADATNPAKASAELFLFDTGTNPGDCPSGTQVEVVTYSNGAPVDEPFYLVLDGPSANFAQFP